MDQFWNQRYGQKEYAYGILPNAFFHQSIIQMKPGKMLLPCEGEGRNAAYAASLGWEVEAFDLSEAGKQKAQLLAAENNVQFKYDIASVEDIELKNDHYDLIALIFSHLPPHIRIPFHKKLINCLKPGGFIVLEHFNPNQLNNQSGGPKQLDMLATPESLQEEFAGLHFEYIEMLEIELNEGPYHQGKADVIRMVGRK